jgi:hypothetical protein
MHSDQDRKVLAITAGRQPTNQPTHECVHTHTHTHTHTPEHWAQSPDF